MTPKQYLSQACGIEGRVARLKEKITELREMSIGIGGIDYSADRVQSSLGANPKYAKYIDTAVDMERNLMKIYNQSLRQQGYVVEMLKELPDPLWFDILFMRYIQGKGWKDITESLKPNKERSIYVKHGKALEWLAQNYDFNQNPPVRKK